MKVLAIGIYATPNGRNAFEPLAERCSPTHNTDKKDLLIGLKAFLNF